MLGYLAVLTASLLWSAGGLFIKLVPWNALSINAARCFLAVFVRAALRKSFRIKITLNTLLTAVFFCGTTFMFALATKHTTSANAIVLQFSYFIFLFVLISFRDKRKPFTRDIVSAVIILGGIILCFFDNLSAGGTLGNIYGLLSGLFFALYFFFNSSEKASPGDGSFLGFFLCAVIGAPWLVRETDFSPKVLICVAVLGIAQMGLAYYFFEYGFPKISPIGASFVTAIEPILNPVWVAIFYGEYIGVFAIVGGVIVVAAAIYHSVISARNAVAQT